MDTVTRNRFMLLGVFCGLAGKVDVASAQTAAHPFRPESVSAAPAQRSLTPDQMWAQSRTILPQMEQATQTVRRQLHQAREARDVVRGLCLNDKLNQMDVGIRTAHDRMIVLATAHDANDSEGVRRAFAALQVLRDRSRALAQEANQCVGEEPGFEGGTKVSVRIATALPSNDPTLFPVDTGTIIVIPNQPSPTR